MKNMNKTTLYKKGKKSTNKILKTHYINIPKEEISCPGCGRLYGHRKTKVCAVCQECSACHKTGSRCYAPRYVTADTFILSILK